MNEVKKIDAMRTKARATFLETEAKTLNLKNDLIRKADEEMQKQAQMEAEKKDCINRADGDGFAKLLESIQHSIEIEKFYRSAAAQYRPYTDEALYAEWNDHAADINKMLEPLYADYYKAQETAKEKIINIAKVWNAIYLLKGEYNTRIAEYGNGFNPKLENITPLDCTNGEALVNFYFDKAYMSEAWFTNGSYCQEVENL